MRPLALSCSLALIACGGDKDEDTAPVLPTCDDYVTAPFSSLTPDEWPEGMDFAVAALQDLSGVWQATHCLDETKRMRVKVSAMPSVPDEITIVRESITDEVVCGCGLDLKFAHDNAMDLVGLLPAFSLFIESDDGASIDPGVDSQSFDVEGALFAGADGLMFRGCVLDNIDPYLASTYDRVAIAFRIETAPDAGVLEWKGDVSLQLHFDVLEGDQSPMTCEVPTFEQFVTATG